MMITQNLLMQDLNAAWLFSFENRIFHHLLFRLIRYPEYHFSKSVVLHCKNYHYKIRLQKSIPEVRKNNYVRINTLAVLMGSFLRLYVMFAVPCDGLLFLHWCLD